MSSSCDRQVKIVNNLLQQAGLQNSLTDVQKLVLRHCYLGNSYQEIADNSNYEYGYIKKVGSQLWRLLSRCIDRKVSKHNLRSLLHREIQKDVHVTMSYYLKSSEQLS